MSSQPFSGAETRLPIEADVLAPDGSEIRLLVQSSRGSMVHCTLAAGATSIAVAHRTVEEVWYCLQGRGAVWRAQGNAEQIVAVREGISLSIPLGVRFQFCNLGEEPLIFLIVTMPPWPGDEEAYRVRGAWEPSLPA
jgi:mannose-6-phosphate isomerase-like protein (cupin superfamily)